MKYGFLIIAILFFVGLLSYSISRGVHLLRPMPIVSTVYTIGMIVGFLCFIVGNIWGTEITGGRYITLFGYSFFIFLIYLFVSFVLVDIVRIVNYFAHFTSPVGMTVFREWAFGISFGLIAILMVIGNYKFNHPAVTTLELSVANPTQGKEVKIVGISDVHLGLTIDKKKLKKYVQLINEKHPDIVLMAGDVIDRLLKPVEQQQMHEELSQIHAPLGVYAVTGNHEFYSGTLQQIQTYIESAGIVYLRDSAFLVDNSFYIVGRDDRTNKLRKPIAEIINRLETDKPIILLDHQPFKLEEAELSGVDLQLSGHTHNGQFFPGNLFIKNMYEVPVGYKQKGKTHYYVSSGLGLWGPPYRIGTRSEIVVIKLKI